MTSVSSPSPIQQGNTETVSVGLENLGDFSEGPFDVTLTSDVDGHIGTVLSGTLTICATPATRSTGRDDALPYWPLLGLLQYCLPTSELIFYCHKYTVPSRSVRLSRVTRFVMPGLTRKKVRPGTGREAGLGHPFFSLG